MQLGLLYLLYPLITVECAAFPLLKLSDRYHSWKSLQQYRLDQSIPSEELGSNPGEGLGKFTLPLEDNSPSMRVLEIEQKRQGYLYGPSLLGNTSWFPTGVLGKAMVQQHMDQWLHDASWLTNVVEEEVNTAAEALKKFGALQNLHDYRVLYENQWKKSIPSQLPEGVLSNSTSDLLFSMERLSVNPYAVRRLHPTDDTLPFEVEPATSAALTGADLQTLHQAGRLFYIDHSYQAAYPTSVGKYSAACSAYFFIHPISGDFLPLAIKTNVGSNLVYTPFDVKEDWLLAKAMFNMNDLFHGQIFHLANTHAVNEVVHQAALRTMSIDHPVLGLLDRLMHHAYAIRPIGEQVLFNSGGYFDQSFAITNQGVRMFATEFYARSAGSFEANYFYTDLTTRGLLNCTYGPALKSFPFFEDASILHLAIRRFMASFIDAYYLTNDVLAKDHEVQSWIMEATYEALVINFPSPPLRQKETLIEIMTQIAFLAGVSHHVLNSNEPVATSGVLPLHPSALYAPVPTKKGIVDMMPYLTPAEEAIKHIALLARFSRPQLEATNETLLYMFSSDRLLNKCHPRVREAAYWFHIEMKVFSQKIRRRGFDAEGLSQGMPFLWQVLDPSRIPYFLSV